MIQLTTRRLRGNFVERIERRAQLWSKIDGLVYRLVVPPHMKWWYWQEFGVPAHRINPIYPKNMDVGTGAEDDDGGRVGSDVLVYDGPGGLTFSQVVTNHPGIPAHRTVWGVVIGSPALQMATDQVMQHAMHMGAADDPELIAEAIEEIMRRAKRMIVDRMRFDLRGRRPYNPEFPAQSGKLMGRTAAEVFDEEADIVKS